MQLVCSAAAMRPEHQTRDIRSVDRSKLISRSGTRQASSSGQAGPSSRGQRPEERSTAQRGGTPRARTRTASRPRPPRVMSLKPPPPHTCGAVRALLCTRARPGRDHAGGVGFSACMHSRWYTCTLPSYTTCRRIITRTWLPDGEPARSPIHRCRLVPVTVRGQIWQANQAMA